MRYNGGYIHSATEREHYCIYIVGGSYYFTFVYLSVPYHLSLVFMIQ